MARPEGFMKEVYRRFNIKDTPSDDYAIMREMLDCRFRRAKLAQLDLVLIDGDRNQLRVALAVLAEYGLSPMARQE